MEVDATEWDAICRICLQGGQLHSVFDFDDEKSELNIAEKIMLCSTIEISAESNLPEQICTDCLCDLDVAFRFRKNCERSDSILQSFVDSTVETITDDYAEEGSAVPVQQQQQQQRTKDGRVLVTSDCGLYEYRPPVGLNVKLVKNDRSPQSSPAKTNRATAKKVQARADEHAMYLKPDPDDMDILEERIDELYDSELNFDDSTNESERQSESEKSQSSSNKKTEIIQFKEVRTNKVRLGRTTQKTKIIMPASSAATAAKDKVNAAQSVQNKTSPQKSAKARTNAKGEPKQPKKCEICGNEYMYQHALDSHMRRHRNEKPFVCSVCNKGFVINFELSRHMRTHTGQKPYACKYCERRFSDFGSRVKHERIHTGERPYACEICGKTFAYSHVLSSHNLIHTGEKKYHCEVCGKRFAKSHHLKAHMNTHNKHNNVAKIAAQQQQQQQAPQEYSLEVIDEQSQMDDGNADGDITEYISLSQNDDDGTASEGEGQLLLYSDVDLDVLNAIKAQNAVIKRKYVTTKETSHVIEDENGIQHEITIADQDPIELLTFEDDDLE